jgi:NADH-quinone oxidoreductase subunit L
MGASVLAALGGIALAWSWYRRRNEAPERLAARMPATYRVLLNKYYVDELYDAAVVTPTVRGSEKLLWRIVDVHVIDWMVNACARFFVGLGAVMRRLQTGAVQSYMLVFIAGVVFVIGWLLVK